MPQYLLSLITLLATGAHAVFGCCWHHEHAGRHATCDAAQTVAHSLHQECCEHTTRGGHAHHEHQQTPEAAEVLDDTFPCGHRHHHDSDPCDQGHCQYLTNAKVELPALSSQAAFDDLLTSIAGAHRLAANPNGFKALPLSAALLSGRLHVLDLTQVALL